jgi:hypothetical protein
MQSALRTDTTPVAPAASRPTAEDQKLARELAERERQLQQREADMASRERELAEQRRVLADQYRLLNARQQPPAQPQAVQPAAAAAATSGTAASWPPAAVSAKTAARPRVYAASPSFDLYQPKRRSGFWRRFKNTLLGTPEAVLEDSL